jgi:hypothetical protein
MCLRLVVVVTNRFQGQAAARLLIGKGYRNVAMVYEDSAYGYGLAFNFIAAFTKGEQHFICLAGFTCSCLLACVGCVWCVIQHWLLHCEQPACGQQQLAQHGVHSMRQLR